MLVKGNRVEDRLAKVLGKATKVNHPLIALEGEWHICERVRLCPDAWRTWLRRNGLESEEVIVAMPP